METVRIHLPHTKAGDQLPILAPINEEGQTTHFVYLHSKRVSLVIDAVSGAVSIGSMKFRLSSFVARKHILHRHITIDAGKRSLVISYCPEKDPSTVNLLGQLNLLSLSPPGYVLLRPLSIGVSSTVFLGRHLETGRIMAVKLTRSIDIHQLALDKSVVEKAIKIPSQDIPRHSAIHSFEHSTWYGRNLYSISEFANGLSALNMMQNGRSEDVHFSDVQKVMKDVLSGLAHVHSYGVVHGNLSLQNILIHTDNYFEGQSMSARLTGFTFAQSLKGKEYPQPHKKCYYKRNGVVIPPEGFKREAPTPEADVWAAGMVLKSLLTYAEENLSSEEHDLMSSLVSALLQPVARRRLTARAALEHPVFSRIQNSHDSESSSVVDINIEEQSDVSCELTSSRDPVVTFRNAVKKVTAVTYTTECWKSLIEVVDSVASSTNSSFVAPL